MKIRRVAFIHASPAALPPVLGYYREAAPDLEITNLLDDGLLRLFAKPDWGTAERRLGDMLDVAREIYCVEAALLTCSAVPREMLERLRLKAGFPVLKIDETLARAAVRAGQRIGLLVTFAPTLEVSRAQLDEAAREAGRSVEVVPRVAPEAYRALLAQDAATHDRLVMAAARELASEGIDVLVLAQVSMVRVLSELKASVKVPVLTSLQTSLDALRKLQVPLPRGEFGA
jgi:aspartate/glutamate racemase